MYRGNTNLTLMYLNDTSFFKRSGGWSLFRFVTGSKHIAFFLTRCAVERSPGLDMQGESRSDRPAELEKERTSPSGRDFTQVLASLASGTGRSWS